MKPKKILLIFLSILIIQPSILAKDLSSLMDAYGNKEDVKLVNVNKAMLAIARAAADKESRKVLKNVKEMKILSSNNSAQISKLISDINILTTEQNYESAEEINEKGETVNLYYKELQKDFMELVIAINEKSGTFNMILINGNIKPDEFDTFK